MERIDRLVQRIGERHGTRSEELDEMISLVDARLAVNRSIAA